MRNLPSWHAQFAKANQNFEAGKLVPISDFVVGSLVHGLHFQLTAQLTEYSEWFINFIPKGGIVDKYWLLRTQRLSTGSL